MGLRGESVKYANPMEVGCGEGERDGYSTGSMNRFACENLSKAGAGDHPGSGPGLHGGDHIMWSPSLPASGYLHVEDRGDWYEATGGGGGGDSYEATGGEDGGEATRGEDGGDLCEATGDWYEAPGDTGVAHEATGDGDPGAAHRAMGDPGAPHEATGDGDTGVAHRAMGDTGGDRSSKKRLPNSSNSMSGASEHTFRYGSGC